jgi:hypothetical protein
VDEPEEARGQQDAGSDIFIWNQTDYQTDDNMGTLESRGSSGKYQQHVKFFIASLYWPKTVP